MKHLSSFLLIISLILILFAGCGEQGETPTNASLNATTAVVESEKTENSSVVTQPKEPSSVAEQSHKEEEVQNEQPVGNPSSKAPAQSTASALPSNSTVSQLIVSKDTVVNTPSENTDAPVADIVVEYPTFTGESSLKNWLLGNHPNYFADKRNDMLNTMGNKGDVIYYKPSIPSNHSLFTLSQVEVHTPSGGMIYFYNGIGEESELVVFVGTRDATAQGFGKSEANRYATIKSYCLGTSALPEGTIAKHVISNGLDFYYKYSSNQEYTTVAWKQYDLYQIATLQGHFDQIEEIIPLLYLQQVKVNGDAVIK